MNSQKIKTIIEELLAKTPFSVDRMEDSVDNDTGALWYSIYTNDSYHFIGKNGETLEALNHIIKKMAEKTMEENENALYPNIVIDINNFQKKKIDNLKAIAHMMGERARFFKSNIEIDPMTSYERKIVHTFFEGKKDLTTESVGEGRNRHIVVKYIGE